MPDFNDYEYWLERAAEAREVAQFFVDEEARKQMIDVAEAYLRLAKMAEQMRLSIKRR